MHSLTDYIDRKPDFSKLSQAEQVKYMAFFYAKISGNLLFTPKNIVDCFDSESLKKPGNIHDVFNKLAKRDIFLTRKGGYIFQRDVLSSLETEFHISKPVRKVSKSLRDFSGKIKNPHREAFLKEVIDCYEVKAYRASAIMTWILCLDTLYDYIFRKKLPDFNTALSRRRDLKISKIKNKDDFCELKESDFIEICKSAGIITKDIRKLLDEKLGFRNSIAHPSGIKIGESKATSFIEDLMDNVILVFK